MGWKKLLSVFMILAMIVSNISTFNINAQNEDYDSEYIKVGLDKNFKNKATINLGGDGFTVGIENGEIDKLFDINDQNVVAKPGKFSYHIEISEKFSSYGEALEKSKMLNALGVDSYVAYKGGFKVYIGEFGSESSANEFLTSNIVLGSESTEISQNEPLISIENTSGLKIISFDKNQKIYIKSLKETTAVGTKKYRGFISFVNNNSTITAINYVKIGDYLKGVVPREMSGSWDIEALKAQTVSARNFAIRNLEKHKSLGYGLCDTDNCQVYEGYGIEHPNSNRAIEETRSKVLKYNGEIIQTFYSSSSGGYIANNEDVWNGEPIPYLRAKVDPYSVNAPNSNWSQAFTRAEVSNKLKASGYDVGQIISIEPRMDELGARVIELKVTGTSGTKSILREKVRTVFGLKSMIYTIEGLQPSQPIPQKPSEPFVTGDLYVVSGNDTNPKKTSLNNINVITAEGVKKLNPDLDKVVISNGVDKVVVKTSLPPELNVIGDTITFKGSGWGHGIGMSQYGALKMAKEGYNYIEILEFYFTGTRVE